MNQQAAAIVIAGVLIAGAIMLTNRWTLISKYSVWGQKLERELNRIDPNGAPGRRFDAQNE